MRGPIIRNYATTLVIQGPPVAEDRALLDGVWERIDTSQTSVSTIVVEHHQQDAVRAPLAY